MHGRARGREACEARREGAVRPRILCAQSGGWGAWETAGPGAAGKGGWQKRAACTAHTRRRTQQEGCRQERLQAEEGCRMACPLGQARSSRALSKAGHVERTGRQATGAAREGSAGEDAKEKELRGKGCCSKGRCEEAGAAVWLGSGASAGAPAGRGLLEKPCGWIILMGWLMHAGPVAAHGSST